MRPINDLLARVIAAREEDLARERARWSTLSEAHRGAHAAVVELFGVGVAELIPPSVTIDELAKLGEGALQDVRARLRLCGGCPDHGGACANAANRQGELPTWRNSTLEWAECKRWPRYQMWEALGSFRVPLILRGANLSTATGDSPDSEAALATCREYVSQYLCGDRRNLILMGGVGVGKSHFAAAVLAEIWKRSRKLRACFVPVAAHFADLRRAIDHRGSESAERAAEVTERMMSEHLVVLDDLGMERTSPWVVEQLEAIIDRRSGEALPMVVTTNCDPDQLAAALGPRATSRLFDDPVLLRLGGKDRRMARTLARSRTANDGSRSKGG